MLKVENLSISFGKKNSQKEVVHEISFHVPKNKIVGIVGESGSGKSVTSMAIMGLLPQKTTLLKGRILFEGKNLLDLSKKEFHALPVVDGGKIVGIVTTTDLINYLLECIDG